jgi:hypothetical protein
VSAAERGAPAHARALAGRLAERFRHDASVCERLNDAQQRLREANGRLWSGLHPDGLAAVHWDRPGALAADTAEERRRLAVDVGELAGARDER